MTNGTRGSRCAAPGYDRYPHLFSEGRFGRLTLRNRIIMAPMGTGFATSDGRVTDRHLHYYAERAAGGVGMVITEVVGVEGDIDPTPAGNLLRLDSDLHIAGFSDLARVIHDHGAAACIQLTPGFGRQGQAPPGRGLVSSSDTPSFTDPKTTARGLSREEIARLVRAFGEAARRAASAGFDAVEIHGHTGYLVDQFLSPLWNTRTDEYGGSLDNRVRFAVELIGSVRERLGPDFPVSFRFSADLKVPG
ncbi:MAG TPA: NADH:flavin oxidoreductase, partial [Clostridiales bacterium]|nr:NADH:flavin oxidoreductase [Clostridiales bacterium]